MNIGALFAGRYLIAELIGRGGTGTVYAATDTLWSREVALKILRPEVARDARLRRRLRREARAVARIEHPNIVRLFELGEHEDGSPFLVMERVRGPSMHTLAPSIETWGRVASLFQQVLGALAFAHARGVVHRDLKPQNIIVSVGASGEDIVKVLDFGFARVEDDSDDQLTATSKDVFGTPTYMSPEQATGDHEVGPASDLYSVGVMLWEMVCGAPPFQGATGTAVVVQHVTAPLPAFHPVPGLVVPPALEAVVSRALEKEPPKRFASAAHFRWAIESLATGLVRPEKQFLDDEPTLNHLVVPALPPRFDGVLPEVSTPLPAGGPRGGHRRVEPDFGDNTGPHTGPLAAPKDHFRADADGPVVGREDIQRWLWARALHTCQNGQPHFVLLEGTAGIGKSTVCRWLEQTMNEGGWMTVLHGRFQVGDSQGGLRQAVRRGLRLPDTRVSREVLEACLAELGDSGAVDITSLSAWLHPEMGAACPPGRALRALEQVTRVLCRRGPLYIWLDDVHHAEPEAFLLFEHLVTNLTARPAPVLLVATRRGDAPLASTPAMESMAAFLLTHHERIELRGLGRLDEPSTRLLLSQAAALGPRATASVLAVARGNPLHALESIRFLRSSQALVRSGLVEELGPVATPLPRTLLELTRARLATFLEGYGPELASWAERLALLGATFSFSLAEVTGRAFGLDVVRLETLLESLVAAGVLVDEEQERYAFRHELLREALLAEVDGRDDAAVLHERIAETLLSHAGANTAAVSIEVSRHFRAAGRTLDAVRHALVAARDARNCGQALAAVGHLQAAERWLSETDLAADGRALLCDLWTALAELSLDASELDRAARLADRVEQSARIAGDERRIASALGQRAEAQLGAGRWLEAERLATEAREICVRLGDGRGVARLDLALGRAALQSSQMELARTRFQEAARGSLLADDRAGAASAKRAIGELALRAGDRPAATRILSEAVALAQGLDDHRLLGQAAWRLGDLLRQAGQLEAAVGRYQQAVDACEAIGDQLGLGRALRGLGDAERLLRRPSAEHTYRRAVELFESTNDRFQLAVCHTQMGRLATERGELTAAEACFEQALGALEGFDDPVRVGVLHAYLARVAVRRGDTVARDARLQLALRIDATRPLVVQEWPVILEEVARQLAAAGDAARSRRLFERAAEVWSALGRADDAERCQVESSNR